MRRRIPDFSYQERTREIIDSNYSPWELTRRDEREGFHRMVNKAVCLNDELFKEFTYVENMFFPEQMDLSEEWVIYRTEPAAIATDIYLSGEPVSEALTLANSIDELIGYYMDVLINRNTVSGVTGTIESMVATNATQAYVLSSGYVWSLDMVQGISTGSHIVDMVGEVEDWAEFDSKGRSYRITENFMSDSVSVTTASGIAIPFTLINSDNLTGIWNPDFDTNKDGLIDEHEKTAISQLYGKSMQDFTPDEWTLADWADVNKDGKISEIDYRSVMSAYPSASPDTKGVIRVPASHTGRFKVRYIPDNRKIKALHTLKDGYIEIYTETELYDYAEHITYDDNTGIYYGTIRGSDSKELRAFTYDKELDKITGDVLIHAEFWNSLCSIKDMDIAAGHLFLLVTDGSTYKVLYGDIWNEYVDSISLEASIEMPTLFKPTFLAATEDGYIILAEGVRFEVFKPIRDRYYEMDGVTYFNRRKVLTQPGGAAYTIVPHYIFNNFDSFAYSFGIDRPWGADNLTMRKLMLDFYDHPQGHDKRGICYGIMRELGYTNETIAVSGIAYILSSELTRSGVITVNDSVMTVTDIDDDSWTLSGTIGTIEVLEGTRVIPDAYVTMAYDVLSIQGHYVDGNGDLIELTQEVSIKKGVSGFPFEISTMAEVTYLSGVGLYVSGQPTSGFVEIVNTAEDNSPFIYKNCRPDKTLVDVCRLSELPLVPTTRNPMIFTSGIIDQYGDTEITL